MGLLVFAVLVGIFYHFAHAEGFLAQPAAAAAIQQAHQENFIPKISKNKVEKLLDTDTVFIDARLTADYQAGHLKGAINIPVNASDEEYQKTTSHIDKNARIIIYCQSAGCPFAQKITFRMQADGYSHISIFKGGWQKWSADNNP